MELYNINQVQSHDHQPFIEANTVPMDLATLTEDHIIPVFSKDNTPLISQSDFINSFVDEARAYYGEASDPEIRVSHPIKGRIPSARNKRANELEPHEKTIYYQRMMFVTRIKSNNLLRNGQEFDLIAGGIKAYNQDRLDSFGSKSQHFNLFIGIQVKVCANMSVFTDGTNLKAGATSLGELSNLTKRLFRNYTLESQLTNLEELPNYALDEDQFAHFVGRCRIYHNMAYKSKKHLPELLLGDSQISSVTGGYLDDKHFSHDNGFINLWSLYNLFTAANKSSYIDKSLERNVNAFDMVKGLKHGLDGDDFWYLNGRS